MFFVGVGSGTYCSFACGTLTASGPGSAGEIRLTSGDVAEEAIQLHGRVESAADMTITATGGAINGTARAAGTVAENDC
jgi:hypothetical protein